MEARVSPGVELAKRPRAQPPAAPIDLLGIERELTRLSEASEYRGHRAKAVLGFVLRLTNAMGAAYLETGSRQMNWREVLWREGDGGFQQLILEALDGPVRHAAAKGVVLAGPLEMLPGHFAITVPVVQDGRTRGVANLVLVAPTFEDIQPFVAVIQAAMGFLHYALLHDEAEAARIAVEQTAALVELGSLAASAPFFEESARILADGIQKHLGCHQVALGRVRGRRARLLRLSGADHFDTLGNATRLIESAMQDALITGGPVRWPRDAARSAGDAGLADVAHEELHRTLGLDRVQTMPLSGADGRVVAMITLLWKGVAGPSPESDRFLEAAAPHLGSLLGALRRADPGGMRKTWHHLWGGLTRARKAIVASAAVALLVVLAMPMRFPVKVDCMVDPVLRRVVPAQFDGILKESYFKPGDFVKQGDLLAMMDDKQLLWRKAELVASRDRAIRQRDLAMADPRAAVATAQMAQLEADGIEQELRLIAFKEQNLELRAPIDGMILTGDLERARGIPVGQGDVMFEIGPVDEMIAELRIPAYDISLVKEGDPVTLRLSSFPGKTWEASLRRIRPQAETVDGESVFVAEALLAGDETHALRAGMKGRASVRGESGPVAWVLTRRLWGLARTTLFW